MTQSNTQARNLLYLFDKPAQPIFRPKGLNSQVNFEVPASFYIDRYKSVINQPQTRFNIQDVIPVKEISPPNILIAESLDKRSNFSVFNSFHSECATNLIKAFMDAKNVDDFLSTCVYAQQRVNPYLFIYALSVAILHRKDTKNVPLPSHVCSFPELYIDGTILSRVREVGSIFEPGTQEPIEIPMNLTASDLDVEHRLAYFREDIGINLHHWHWHLIYPTSGSMEIVNKDRRGELFYYMHQQIIARYNIERFSNYLPRVGKFHFYQPIPEGYFPKLDSIIASRVYPARQANTVLLDINREADQLFVRVDELVRWYDRIYEAIQRRSVLRGTDLIPLEESNGIDILGNLVESSILSINRDFYGNLHNQGHNMLSFIHDPDNRHLETYGVIGDNTTAMRDPVFYRWHTTINDIFEEYKRTLTPYTVQQLSFNGIEVTQIELNSSDGGLKNVFQTFWEKDKVDLSRGVDFLPSGPVFAAFTHLQHKPFTYRIRCRSTNRSRIEGTVRIFLAPKNDERGTPFRFRDQKGFFIELDRFTTMINNGDNTIERMSDRSSLTVPFSQTFRNLDPPPLTSATQADDFVFCGCGWPDHALIPKGLPGEGLLCDLFVMITNYVQDDQVVRSGLSFSVNGCDDAFSFCGVRNNRYPDRRPMGFPFDRLPRNGVITLNQFLTPNMRTQDVRIVFTEGKPKEGITYRQQTNQPQQLTSKNATKKN